MLNVVSLLLLLVCTISVIGDIASNSFYFRQYTIVDSNYTSPKNHLWLFLFVMMTGLFIKNKAFLRAVAVQNLNDTFEPANV
jgi:hypothetical protein